jgi:hypothetical protein
MEYRNSFGQIYDPPLVSITPGQSFELNLDTSEYTSAPYPPKPLTKKEIEPRGLRIPTTQLEERSLDPALFEIPPGFKHEEQIERNPVGSARSSQMKHFCDDSRPAWRGSFTLRSRCWSFWLPSSCRPRQLKEVNIWGESVRCATIHRALATAST